MAPAPAKPKLYHITHVANLPVYLGVIVTLVAALRQGPTPRRMKTLVEVFGVDRRTAERWGRWWREDFATSAPWRLGREGRPESTQRMPAVPS